MPEAQVYDSQRSLSSSGGVFQYQVNAFICQLLEISDLTLADLDKFATQIRFPRNHGKVSSQFFEERIRIPSTDNPTPHWKAFAGETLMALDILWFFSSLALPDIDAMAEHVRCLNLAVKLMDYLRSGDRVCDMLDAAEETQRLHHELFVALYPPAEKTCT